MKIGTKARRHRGTKGKGRVSPFVPSCLRAFVPVRPIAMLACILCVSCADKSNPTTRPLSARERQDQALRDPFSYGPQPNKQGTDMPSVSGGGIGEFNRKEFDRDVNRVLNP